MLAEGLEIGWIVVLGILVHMMDLERLPVIAGFASILPEFLGSQVIGAPVLRMLSAVGTGQRTKLPSGEGRQVFQPVPESFPFQWLPTMQAVLRVFLDSFQIHHPMT